MRRMQRPLDILPEGPPDNGPTTFESNGKRHRTLAPRPTETINPYFKPYSKPVRFIPVNFKTRSTLSPKDTPVPGYAVVSSSKENPITISSQETAKSEGVQKYPFTSEDDSQNNLADDMDDVRSHISLSSTESDHADDYALDDKPWLSMDDEQRAVFERQFTKLTFPALGGSWKFTEEYQFHLDNLFMKYAMDVPLHKWVLPQEEVAMADRQLRERRRLRSMGQGAYAARITPGHHKVSMPPDASSLGHLPGSTVPGRSHPAPIGRVRSEPSQAQPRLVMKRTGSAIVKPTTSLMTLPNGTAKIVTTKPRPGPK